MQRRGRLQRLRSKFHHARHGVRHRVATTISNIRDRSYAYAGFPTGRPAGSQDECSDPARARYMQLANTIVRALLVEEVTYESSSLLKKSRKAAVLITGADLVLVKLTTATKAGSSTVSRSSSTPAEGTAGSTATAAAAAAAVGGSSRLVSSRTDGGFDAAAAAAAEARASVLAQHELNKMVKCEVSGDRLELEFIVTGGAQFKVSAAALGLNAASFSSSTTTQVTAASAGKTGSGGSSSAVVGGGAYSTFLEQEEAVAEDNADVAAAADVFPMDAADTAAGLGRRSGSSERQQQERRHGLSANSLDSAAVLGSLDAALLGQSSLQDATAVGSRQEERGQLSGRAGSSGRASSGEVDERPVAGYGNAALLEDGSCLSERAGSIRSFDLVPPNSTAAVPVADRTLGSRTLARLINRYNSSSGVFPAGSPPLLGSNGASLPGAAAGGGSGGSVSASRSFVRGLGSRALGVAEDGSRSSIRAVKTADGEYLVWVESFSLTFSNPSLAEMAAELLRAGRSSMRQALEWLKQGLPFNPEFAITHITELPSRAAADEVLRAGPTSWGTVLQLPDSWVQAVSAAQLPEEQPLSTALEVPEGPAAFKIHLATPAGLAEATLLPELIAVLSQLPCTHEEHVLAVPVNLTLQVPAADTEQEHDQQEQEQQQAARWGCISRAQPAAGQAGNNSSSTSDSKQPAASKSGSSPPPAAAAGRGLSVADRGKLGSQKGLTWADRQRQQEGSSDDCSADFAADSRRSFGGGRVPAAAQQAAFCTGSPAAGKGLLAMHHSLSTPHLGQLERLLPASVEFDSCDEADRFEQQQEVREQRQQRDSGSAALRPRADSSSSLPDLPPHQQRGLSLDSWRKADAVMGSDLSTVGTAAVAGGAGAAASSTGADEQQPTVGGLSGILRQQSGTHLSFAAEVHAVLHVRLLLDTESGSSMQPAAAGPCLPAAAGTEPAVAGRHISPFALAGALDVLDDSGMPLSGSLLEIQHTALPQTPSILQLGTTEPAPPSAAQQQLLQTAAALVAALLCGLALLLPSTSAASILVLCAALANLACMAAALQPLRFSSATRPLQRLLRPGHSSHAHAHAHGHQPRSSHIHHHHSSHHHHHHGVKRQHSKRPSAPSGQRSGTCSAAAPARKLQGLRLQLLGGSFVKEALGLLEQQIAAYRDSVESPDSCSASFVSGSESGDDLESLEGSSEDEELAEAVFVSSPEPAWLTRDWRRRLWNARPTMEERSRLAGIIHAWRQSVAADVILQRPPPNFARFQKHLVLRPLLTTPQGHVVVLLKLSTLSNMPRVLAGCGLTPTDLMRHCALIWCWMFETYAAADWPAGRFILLADMSGLKLGQSVGEGQIGGRALGEVCNAFPERLTRCLVLGAPNWFNMLYRLIRPQLSPSTRAKVQVCTTAAETVAELACCLGPEWVPAEYGGPCTRPYDEFPAQQALLQHVAKLHSHSA